MALAAEVYRVLSSAEGVPAPLRREAGERLAVLGGGGGFTQGLLYAGEHLLDTVVDISMLAGMGAGSMAYRLGRFGTLWPVVGAGRAGWMVRVLGSAVGVGTESLAFTAAAKGVRTLQGLPEDWSLPTLEREFVGMGLVLGSLRIAGTLASGVGRALHGGELLSQRACPSLSGRRAQALLPFYRQGGMYAGIVLGHGLQGVFQLPGAPDLGHLWTHSLLTLVHFNLGGWFAKKVLGEGFARLEQRLDQKIRRLEQEGRGPRGPWLDRLAAGLFPQVGLEPALNGAGQAAVPGVTVKIAGEVQGTSLRPEAVTVSRPPMGLRLDGRDSFDERPALRVQAAAELKQLMPEGQIDAARLADPSYVSRILTNFNITDHPLDQQCFHQGLEVAQRFPERIGRVAFDVDEVILHWSFSLRETLRDLFRRSAVQYHHTAPQLLNYESFQADPKASTGLVRRFWANVVQKYLASHIYHHVQFHPGMRAFLLGLRLGQERDLIMATTGATGRILILANEDPALKKIFFGKSPTEVVTIEEVRNGKNIYTREDMVLALRSALEGTDAVFQHVDTHDYVQSLWLNPRRPEKFKHPGLALIRGKRPFDILVDDSSAAYERLSGAAGFTVLRPPSARPARWLNMVLSDTGRYLDRMPNGYVPELAKALAGAQQPVSQAIPVGEAVPADYRHQRFVLAVPCARFHQEFHLPGAELRHLAGRIAASPSYFLEGQAHPSFPYLRARDGSFVIPGTGKTVVVIGDHPPNRTYDLASQGHLPIHIEHDRSALTRRRREFAALAERESTVEGKRRLLSVQWLKGYPNTVAAKGEYVEAFLSQAGLARFSSIHKGKRFSEILRLIDKELTPKLRPGGKGIYLSMEDPQTALEIANYIGAMPQLELLEVGNVGISPTMSNPPVRGADFHGSGQFHHFDFTERISWVVYRLKAD
jgi:hypothetical protein